MASTFTSVLKLTKPGLGDPGWGTSINSGTTDLVEQAVAGQISVNVTAAGPFILTTANGAVADARNMFIVATGTPGGAREIQVPSTAGLGGKLFFVKNSSNGTVTVKVSGQTGVAVPAGASMALKMNDGGTDVAEAVTHIAFLTLGAALAATQGGTGQTSYAVGDLLYAGTTTSLAKLAGVATGNVLRSGGVGTAPAWGKVGLTTDVSGTLPVANGGSGAATLTGVLKGNGTAAFTAGTVNLASEVTGTLPVANGGTGAATLTANNVLLGNGTSGVQVVAPGANGNVLTSNGTTWVSQAPASAPVSSVNGLTGAVSMTGLGDIGSYAVLIIATNTDVAVNSTVAGSDLRYGWTPNTTVGVTGTFFPSFGANRHRTSTTYDGGGTSLSGTWRKMSTGNTYGSYTVPSGPCCPPATYYAWGAALYVRIS